MTKIFFGGLFRAKKRKNGMRIENKKKLGAFYVEFIFHAQVAFVSANEE